MSVGLDETGLKSDVARAIEASLARARAVAEPYPNWRLEGLFPEPVARALADLPFHAPHLNGVSGRRELHNDQRSYFAGSVLDEHPVTDEVARAFQSPEVVAAFAQKTGARLAGAYLRIEYAADVDGFWLEPHTDLGVKALTLLIQLPEKGQEGLGTDIYAAPGAWADRADFAWNGALLFVPSDRTWHGFEPRRIDGVRRSVIVNYVTEEWRAREQLAFPTEAVRVG
jgi:hypothetical protein